MNENEPKNEKVKEPEMKWEGIPDGLEEWLLSQDAPLTIFVHPIGKRIDYILGYRPYEAWYELADYLIEDEEGDLYFDYMSYLTDNPPPDNPSIDNE